MSVKIFRTIASLITVFGLVMLGVFLHDWTRNFLLCEGGCAGPFLSQLFLTLPVPLHIIFIGLIIQKKHFSQPWQRFAWIGITASGVWLGISLAIRTFSA